MAIILSNARGGFMPSLFKFLIVVGILAGIVFGTMFALAEFVEPEQREMGYKIPKRNISD